MGDQQGLQMALGNLDINTMERIDNFNPDAPPAQVHSSVENMPNYRIIMGLFMFYRIL